MGVAYQQAIPPDHGGASQSPVVKATTETDSEAGPPPANDLSTAEVGPNPANEAGILSDASSTSSISNSSSEWSASELEDSVVIRSAQPHRIGPRTVGRDTSVPKIDGSLRFTIPLASTLHCPLCDKTKWSGDRRHNTVIAHYRSHHSDQPVLGMLFMCVVYGHETDTYQRGNKHYSSCHRMSNDNGPSQSTSPGNIAPTELRRATMEGDDDVVILLYPARTSRCPICPWFSLASNNEGTESRDTNIVGSLKSHLHSAHQIDAEHTWRCAVCSVVASGPILFAQHRHEGENTANPSSATGADTAASTPKTTAGFGALGNFSTDALGNSPITTTAETEATPSATTQRPITVPGAAATAGSNAFFPPEAKNKLSSKLRIHLFLFSYFTTMSKTIKSKYRKRSCT